MGDCSNNDLYELYNVRYDGSRGAWFAGSGARFDLDTNQRRPDGWTSTRTLKATLTVSRWRIVWAGGRDARRYLR